MPWVNYNYLVPSSDFPEQAVVQPSNTRVTSASFPWVPGQVPGSSPPYKSLDQQASESHSFSGVQGHGSSCQTHINHPQPEFTRCASQANINTPLQKPPKSVVNAALQLYLFNLLALFPWKNIFTHRKYFPQVFSALLLQPPEAMSVVQSPQGDEAKVAGGTWLPLRVTYQLHLATRVKARGAWTGRNSVTSSAGFSPSLSAARRSCSIRSTTGSKCWQH